MRRVITKADAIKYFIYGLLVIAVLTVFPLRLWHENITTCGKEHPAGTVSVGGENTAMQQFTAEYDHIGSIGVYLQGDYFSDTLCLRVFDESYNLLREETVNTSELKKVDSDTYSEAASCGYADVYVNLDTTVGSVYYYTVEGISTDFEIPYEMTGNSGAANNGPMQYAGENRDAYNLMTRYTYTQPLRKGVSLLIIAVLFLIGAAVTFLMNFLKKKSEALNGLCTMRWVIRLVGNPVTVIAAAGAIVCVGPLHMFSIYIADIAVMILGVLLLAASLLYAINRTPEESDTDPAEYVKENWQNLAQAVCIALALWACVNYMNALYEVFHDSAWRKMAFFLGLSIIVTFTRKEALNLYNLALLIIGVITARIYYTHNLPSMVDEYHTEAMLWTCRLMPVILILAAYIIRCIILAVKEKNNPFRIVSWPYTVVTIALAAGMIIQRNTRYWPVMMTVIVGVFAVRFLFWDGRAAFMGNLCNGILIHFGACILYCLWHRPYEAYQYVRYPFVFHTVTITAEYMSLVLAAAAVKLFFRYNRMRRLKACLWEMFMFGTAAVYTFFTMSRTGMIAIVCMGLTMWIAYSFRAERGGRFRTLAVSAGMVILSVLWCFPVFFSLQKAVPAMVGEPKTMVVESYPEDLLVSTDWDSEDYITVTRFAKAFGHKMLGMDEDSVTWDKYTVNGVRDDLYLTPMEVEERDENKLTPDESVLEKEREKAKQQAEEAENSETSMAGLMLSSEAPEKLAGDIRNAALDKNDDGFVPPYDWTGDDPCPDEWYDEDYWVYRPKENKWIFAEWKLDEAANADVSNGRMDIYRAYLDQLTQDGHEGMGAILADGSEAAHAHDIYLQVAFDHGIIIGVLFCIWMAFTCIQALMVFIRRRRFDPSAGMVLAVSVTYAVAGLTEWISHPCNPVGMIMMLMVIPMGMYKYGKDKETV